MLFYHGEELSRSFLESFFLQQWDEADVELVAVYPEKEDYLPRLIEEVRGNRYPLLKIHKVPLETFYKSLARNKGIDNAAGNLLVFLEDDVTLHPAYFSILKEETPKLGNRFAGGGKIIPVFERQKPPWLAKWLMPLLGEINLGEEIKRFPSKRYPLGQNMFMTKDILEDTGCFDENPGVHDSLILKQFFQKLREKNIPVYYLPNLIVWHLVPEKKLDRSYLRRLAEMNVRLDMALAKQRGKKYIWRLRINELGKWLATIILSVYYLLSAQWPKIKAVFQYRYWHTKVLLGS